MKKLLSLLSILTLTVAPIINVISCGEPVLTVLDKENLSIIITHRYLGQMETVPTNQEVLDRVKELNPDVDKDQIKVTSNENGEAVVSAIENSTVYESGNVIVYYTDSTTTLIRLEVAVFINDLGIFSNQPSDQEILERIKEFNPDVDITQLEVTKNINGNATVSVITNSSVYKPGHVDLIYSVTDERINLDTVLIVTNLGEFSTTPLATDILARAQEINRNLNVDEISATLDSDNQATIMVKPDSKIYYQGTINVTYVIDNRILLTGAVNGSDLGIFATTPSNDDILKRLKELNPSLDTNQLNVTAITNGQTTIAVKTDSTLYKPGELNFTYRIDLRQNLSDVITNSNLGTFDSQPTNLDILHQLIILYPHIILNELVITNISNNQAVVTVIDNSAIYKPTEMNLTYSVDERPTINSIITNTSLGEFDNQPSDQDILNQLASLNPNLNINEIKVVTNANNQATVAVIDKSNVYKPGTINLIYTIDTRSDLNTVLTKTDLGEFANQPTDQDILNQLALLNPNLNINEVVVLSNANNQATIGVVTNSGVYKSTRIVVNYTIHQLIDLRTVLTITALEEFESQPTNIQILNQVLNLNPLVNINELIVRSNINNQATIGVKTGSNIYLPEPTVNVTYTVKAVVLPELSSVVLETELGTINVNSADLLLTQIKSLNPDLNENEVEVINITINSATLHVKIGSAVYSPGSLQISFTLLVLPALSTVISTTNLGQLGTIGDSPTSQEVLTLLGKLNPSLVSGEVNVSDISLTQATIKVNSGSRIYDDKSFVNITFNAAKFSTLSLLITNSNLGEFDQEPNNQDILTRLASLYPNLVMSQILVSSNINHQVTLTVVSNSQYYQPGNVVLTYTLHPWIDLVNVVTTTNLDFYNVTPTNTMILNRTLALNPTLNINEVEVINISDTSATIIAKVGSRIYRQGSSIIVSYFVRPLVDLSSIVSVRDLGTFTFAPTITGLLDRLASMTPNLQVNEINISINSRSQATLTVNPDSTVYQQTIIPLTYKIAIPLRTVIVNPDLGWFASVPSTQMLLNQLASLNPGLDISQLRLSIGTTSIPGRPIPVTVSVLPTSDFYDVTSSVVVTYTTPGQLSAVLNNTHIGGVVLALGEAGILQVLKNTFPNLDITQIRALNIFSIPLLGGGADIVVITGSRVYLPALIEITFSIL